MLLIEDVLSAEQHGGPEDGVGDARFDQRPLQPRLAAEILQRRILRRIGDAHVDDPPHAGLPGGRRTAQAYCSTASACREQAMVEPHPVGVVEHRTPRERLGQPVRSSKWNGHRADLLAERVGPPGRVGQRDDRLALVEQSPGDVLAGVSEGPGDGVKHFSVPWKLSQKSKSPSPLSLWERAG